MQSEEEEVDLECTEANIYLWKAEMYSIRSNLIELGSIRCKEKVVSLVKESNLCDNVTSYNEAISCFGNIQLFESKPYMFLSLLHKVQVGIFTQPFDIWAHMACDKWLSIRNAEHLHEPKKKGEREKKSFVLSLLKHKASAEVKTTLTSMTAQALGFYVMG